MYNTFYINDVFSHVNNVKVKMFADDCVLYHSDVCWPRIYNPTQRK